MGKMLCQQSAKRCLLQLDMIDSVVGYIYVYVLSISTPNELAGKLKVSCLILET